MTQPLPSGSWMSQADHASVDYANSDKVKLYIFTTPEHPDYDSKGSNSITHKKDCEPESIDKDIDVETLEVLAKQYNYGVQTEKRSNKKDLLKILEESGIVPEGVFVFVFLTFQVKGADSEKFYAYKDEVTLNDVWDKIKHNPRFIGRPKLILVQADDISLLKTPETPKGDGFVEEIVKLPLECDRLTMISNIPQPGKFKGGSSGKGDGPEANRKPSLLIQAFADVMQENFKRKDTEKWDFLSEMSVYMNSKIQQGINELKGLKKGDGNCVIDEKNQEKMVRHPVVSTLRKDIYFKKNMKKEDKEEE